MLRSLSRYRYSLVYSRRPRCCYFRRVTEPFGARTASKWIGEGWLLASSNGLQSTLVTFDKALYQQARKQGYSVVMPG
jgi:hypothetical protein